MALHQYTLFFIPRLALLERYGEIPAKLEHNTKGWADYLENTENFEDEQVFEDAFTIEWWSEMTLQFEDAKPFLEKFGVVQDWTKDSKNFRSYGESSGHDITIGFNEETQVIEELSCRLDVGKLNEAILSTVNEIASTFDCLLMNSKAEVFKANAKEILERIKCSNAFAFLQDPKQFFTDFESGKIKPE